MSFKTGLDDWEMNLIQGIVNQLQIDLKFLKRGQKGKRNQINASYKMMEVRMNVYYYIYLLFF